MSDKINGLFELCGAGFLLLNILKLRKDREVKGVSWIAVTFFFTWGLWNLHYYSNLRQYYSLAGGVAIAIMNAIWLGLFVFYSRKLD